MSQIRKSASFRSRIPIRRTKLVPRRCYSPEPYRNPSTPAMYDQSHNDNDNNYGTKSMFNHHSNEQRISKQKMKRQRHIATTLAQQAKQPAKPSNDASITSVSNFPVASIRPKTIYSSSSYSSSDESQESEAPPQVHHTSVCKCEFSFEIQIYAHILPPRSSTTVQLWTHCIHKTMQIQQRFVAGTNRIPLLGFIAAYCPNEMRNGREKARVNEVEGER